MKYFLFICIQLASYLTIGYITGLGLIIPLIIACLYLIILNVFWSIAFIILFLLKFKSNWKSFIKGNVKDEEMFALIIKSSYALFILPILLLLFALSIVIISNFENWKLFYFAVTCMLFSYIALRLAKKKIIYPILWDSGSGNGL